MEQLMRGVLWVHVATGFTAFFLAPIPMLTFKGGDVHRRFGRYYFWLTVIMALTGAVVALYQPDFFLVMIAVFAFYFAFRGYRVVLTRGSGPSALDWLVAVVTFVACLAMVVLGIWRPAGIPLPETSVAVIFGGLGVYGSGADLLSFRQPPTDQHAWYYSHINGMLGSYIAALSAFSSVNMHFVPSPWRMLWPTIVGTPLVIWWIGHYRKKFNQKGDAATA
jgi:hypothetical protein